MGRGTKRWAFQLPADNAAIAHQIIGAVPSDWGWVDGQLDAPLTAVAEGRVADAGILIDRADVTIATLYHEGPAMFDLDEHGRTVNTMMRREAHLGLLAGGLHPQFIRFHHAGFDQQQFGPVPFESAKKIAQAWIGRGYGGDLFFHSESWDNTPASPEECIIHTNPFEAWFRAVPAVKVKAWVDLQAEMAAARAAGDHAKASALWEAQNPPKRQHPPLVSLEMTEDHGGTETRIAGLIEACRWLQLAEIDPTAVEGGTSYMQPFRFA